MIVLLEGIQTLLSRSGEIGRRTGLKIQRTLGPCRFESDLRHQAMVYQTIAFLLHYHYIAMIFRMRFARSICASLSPPTS